jgi:hypothetical protein
MARIIDTDYFRDRAVASQGTGGDGGGTVDDILRRLGVVESSMLEIGGDIREIKGVLPHLATKAELGEIRADIREIKGLLPQLATKGELGEVRADLREIKGILPHLATKAEVEAVGTKIASVEGSVIAEIRALETKIIKWFIGIGVAVGALGFSVAKFVN